MDVSPGVTPGRFRMPQLMDVLKLGRCSHEFSWPRRSASGEYYQVCLLCASAYRYDWKTMRRGERVEDPVPDTAAVRRRSSKKRPTWVPRARRLKLNLPIRYRAKGAGAWQEGTIQNISQSGLLFFGAQALPANALLEMIFEMPEEISGQRNSSVLCQGRLVRSEDLMPGANGDRAGAAETEANDRAFELGVSVLDYKFLH